MQVKMNKKVFKISITIIILLVAIVVGILTYQIISTNMNIKQTEQKLSKIDSKELEEKLIKELEKSKLFLELDAGNLFVGTMVNDSVSFKNYISIAYLGIKNGEPVGAVEIPCFKINSDDNGKFKSIEYTYVALGGENTIEEIVKNVFKKEYGIDFKRTWGWNQFNGNFNGMYNRKFNSDKSTSNGTIYIDDQNFFIGILGKLTDSNEYEYGDKVDKYYKEYMTRTFGISL